MGYIILDPVIGESETRVTLHALLCAPVELTSVLDGLSQPESRPHPLYSLLANGGDRLDRSLTSVAMHAGYLCSWFKKRREKTIAQL